MSGASVGSTQSSLSQSRRNQLCRSPRRCPHRLPLCSYLSSRRPGPLCPAIAHHPEPLFCVLKCTRIVLITTVISAKAQVRTALSTSDCKRYLRARHLSAAVPRRVAALFYVLASHQRHLLLAVLPHKRVAPLATKKRSQCLQKQSRWQNQADPCVSLTTLRLLKNKTLLKSKGVLYTH